MERAEIGELFYNTLIDLNNLGELDRFLSARVQLTLSAADPHTVGEEAARMPLHFPGRRAADNWRCTCKRA
jgi:hypothetical protein